MKPELKPSKYNQKNPIHLNETWIGLLATGVSDTQLKTHWLWFTATLLSGGSGGHQLLPTPIPMALEGTDTPEQQREHFLALRL